jgi:hypothetical protein
LIKAGLSLYGGPIDQLRGDAGIFFWSVGFGAIYPQQSLRLDGLILCASTSLVLSWGTVGQVDTLAIFLPCSVFYQYSAMPSRTSLDYAAGACVLIACFTKQTAIACPAAIIVLLWFRNRRTAYSQAASEFRGRDIAINTFTMDASSNTLFANLNPFAWTSAVTHVHYADRRGRTGDRCLYSASERCGAIRARRLSTWDSPCVFLASRRLRDRIQYQIENNDSAGALRVRVARCLGFFLI